MLSPVVDTTKVPQEVLKDIYGGRLWDMVFYKCSLEFDEDVKLAYHEKSTISRNGKYYDRRKSISISKLPMYW